MLLNSAHSRIFEPFLHASPPTSNILVLCHQLSIYISYILAQSTLLCKIEATAAVQWTSDLHEPVENWSNRNSVSLKSEKKQYYEENFPGKMSQHAGLHALYEAISLAQHLTALLARRLALTSARGLQKHHNRLPYCLLLRPVLAGQFEFSKKIQNGCPFKCDRFAPNVRMRLKLRCSNSLTYPEA